MKHGQVNTDLKIFLDANVLLDYYLKREGYESTKQIISLVGIGKCRAYVTATVIHIVNYYLSKEVGIKESEERLLVYDPEEFLKNVALTG